jgi:uncharacterized protein involved in exopolysaccharide biosynthesis
MEDEIDLGKYVRILARRWKLILGLALVSGLIAFLISAASKPVYQATALVVVTRPRYQFEFDPRIQPVSPSQQQPYKAYPELALSDDLLLSVLDAANGAASPEQSDLAEFRGQLDAEAGADPSLVRLHAASPDPKRAQTVVNTWAMLYVDYTNELYQQQSSDVAFFEAQVADARGKLQAAEQALIDFQGRSPLLQVTAQLSSTQTTLADYLDVSRTASLLIQDAQSLRQQLAPQDLDTPAAFADQLSTLYLKVTTLSVATPFTVDLIPGDGGALQGRTVRDEIAALDALMEALADKSEAAQQQAEALGARLLELQQAQQTAQVELDRLTRDRDVANETYLTLTRKLDEANITLAGATEEVRLASRAGAPTEPISPRKTLSAVVGAVLGMALGVILALVSGADRPARQPAAVRGG